MNKTELIKALAGRTTVSQEQTGKMIDALWRVIKIPLENLPYRPGSYRYAIRLSPSWTASQPCISLSLAPLR